MNAFETINWQGKTNDEVYEYIDTLATEDQYPFLKWLAGHAPELDIDWLDIFEDIRSLLPVAENVDACVEFSAWFAKRFPDEYAEHGGFIERDLCDFYLYKGELEKLRERISYISRYPVQAMDVLTVRLLFQLIYHGHYKDAVDFANKVWQPISESDELIGYAEQPFVNVIYTDKLQQCYEELKNNRICDFADLQRLMIELGFDDDKALFENVVSSLKNTLDIEKIRESIRKKNDDHMVDLNIQFLKYMLDTWQMPFVFSDFMWSIIATKKIFGKRKGVDNWFYVDEKTMDKHLIERLDTVFRSNTLEMFGKVWGMHYVFNFLHVQKLLTDEHTVNINDYLAKFRGIMVDYNARELWHLDFVFRWPESHLWEDLKPVFDNTFNLPPAELRSFNDDFNIPDFPENNFKPTVREPEVPRPKESEPVDYFYSGTSPYTKPEKEIGRNDPCPCGSGKKYKKCCMDKAQD
jgi:hypothetical protein